MTRLKAGSLVVLGSVCAVVCLSYLMRVVLIVPGVLAFSLVLNWIMPLAKTALCLKHAADDDQ